MSEPDQVIGAVPDGALPDGVRPGAAMPGAAMPDAAMPDAALRDSAPAADELAFDVADLPGGARSTLEAVLMVADEPIPAVQLASVLALPTAVVEQLLGELAAEYRGVGGGRPRGFDLRHAGAGWRMYSAPSYAEVVGRFVLEGQTARLTQAALETLAVIAYRQPVTRGQVSAVRGGNVDGVVRTLTTRGLVTEISTDPGSGAVLFGTTGYFLERMGLGSLDEMPPLAPYLPDFDAFDGVDDAAGENT